MAKMLDSFGMDYIRGYTTSNPKEMDFSLFKDKLNLFVRLPLKGLHYISSAFELRAG